MVFDPKTWADGELITAADLNRVEQAVDAVDEQMGSKVDTTDPRLSDARPPAAHAHEITDVDGLQAVIDRLTVGTGGRDVSQSISALSFTSPAEEAVISRVGSSVEISIRGRAVGALSSGFNLFTVPSGFRGRGYQYRGMAFNLNTGEVGHVRANSTMASLNAYISATDNQSIMVQCSYRTGDAWPASLPGDPE